MTVLNLIIATSLRKVVEVKFFHPAAKRHCLMTTIHIFLAVLQSLTKAWILMNVFEQVINFIYLIIIQ